MSGPNTISYSFGQMMGAAAAAGAPGQTSYFIARVKSVLLDDSDLPKFNSLGGWKAIGSIECLPFINFNDPKTDPIIARPLRSNYTQYPLVNEAVLVKILISKEAQDNVGNYKPEFYYTDIISVWNAPEHNAVPDKSYFLLNPNDKTGTGKFIQTGETKRLVKAPGDVTLEGRRGGSIRLGSNTPGFKTPWTAAKSKPVMVISNNPASVSGPARFEDINNDGSILFMMSGHNPGFKPSSANFDSYDTIVTISEKQNVVVVDQKPQSEPTASLAQQDAKPIPPDVPVTGSIPVSNPVPPTVINDKKLDEEELPEREDLEEINVQVEYSDEPPVTEAAANIPVVLETKAQSNYNLLIEKIYNPIKNQFKGVYIPITSGYRAPDKNVSVGGSVNSQHTRGEALDIDMGSSKTLKVKNSDIFNYIKNNLNFDQLIWEFGTSTEPDWVHVSYSSSGRQRKDIKKAVKVNGKTQYTPYT